MRTFEKAFWARAARTAHGCWLWSGATSNGYGRVSRGGSMLLVHRVAYELAVGKIPANMQIDHVCGVRACCNPAHLRLATSSENQTNIGLRKDNASGFKGVSFCKERGKWTARCSKDGVLHVLGYFDTPEAASEVYLRSAKALHGEFFHEGPGSLLKLQQGK